jgi:hypothetical protein
MGLYKKVFFIQPSPGLTNNPQFTPEKPGILDFKASSIATPTFTCFG